MTHHKLPLNMHICWHSGHVYVTSWVKRLNGAWNITVEPQILSR